MRIFYRRTTRKVVRGPRMAHPVRGKNYDEWEDIEEWAAGESDNEDAGREYHTAPSSPAADGAIEVAIGNGNVTASRGTTDPVTAAPASATDRNNEGAGSNCSHEERPSSSFCCADSARTFFYRFMTLPREIRDIVYAAKFADLPKSIVLRKKTGSFFTGEALFPPILPAFCFANRQILEESVPALLRGRAITMNGGRAVNEATLIDFLDRIPDRKAYKSISEMRIEDSIRLKANQGIGKAIGLCTSLRRLWVEIQAICFVDHFDRKLKQFKDEKDLLEIYDFTALFDLPKLEVVTLALGGGDYYAELLGCSNREVFEPLVKWFDAYIQRKSSKIRLSLKCIPWRDDSYYSPELFGWGPDS
ncbi:hypothetical protein BU26DRAFT_592568 [Trematosphaeria pertusa]|uniref:F-box domain-containing protein n=1 Tax=Trematosphaeria pertusa TaxID=390896 RepID=A0A6A6IMC1_9PLEO|nr:uncharacterized protein BU26DRAFT_592568 [Trematosphaeria pertusa]KAF2251379.1 hypothetical protein BU26DRAFT_592568 [Trematosphaeria pertusa]